MDSANAADLNAEIAEIVKLSTRCNSSLGLDTLRRNARVFEIEIPETDDIVDISNAMFDVIDSRCASMIADTARRFGLSFDAVQTMVRERS